MAWRRIASNVNPSRPRRTLRSRGTSTLEDRVTLGESHALLGVERCILGCRLMHFGQRPTQAAAASEAFNGRSAAVSPGSHDVIAQLHGYSAPGPPTRTMRCVGKVHSVPGEG